MGWRVVHTFFPWELRDFGARLPPCFFSLSFLGVCGQWLRFGGRAWGCSYRGLGGEGLLGVPNAQRWGDGVGDVGDCGPGASAHLLAGVGNFSSDKLFETEVCPQILVLVPPLASLHPTDRPLSAPPFPFWMPRPLPPTCLYPSLHPVQGCIETWAPTPPERCHLRPAWADLSLESCLTRSGGGHQGSGGSRGVW